MTATATLRLHLDKMDVAEDGGSATLNFSAYHSDDETNPNQWVEEAKMTMTLTEYRGFTEGEDYHTMLIHQPK